MNRGRRVIWMKVGVWALGLFPLAQVGWWLRDGLFGLGANPIQKLMDHAGWWTLGLLMATLAITPIRRLTGWNQLVKLRRPMGLFAFFWGTVHFGIYLGLDQVFEWHYIIEDIVERPFITVGFATWVILLSLAVTSTKGWIRRLGRRWTQLHYGVYLAGLLGVIHFYWKVKADTREPLIFGAVFVGLMALRTRWADPRKLRRSSTGPSARRAGGSESGTGSEAGDGGRGGERDAGAAAGVEVGSAEASLKEGVGASHASDGAGGGGEPAGAQGGARAPAEAG